MDTAGLGEMMYCEIYSCKMLPAACIKRQQNARFGPGSGQFYKPGACDINCRDCEQGRKIMERQGMETEKGQAKIMTETQTTNTQTMKICSSEKCPHGNEPQPLDDFDNSKKSKDGKTAICKECRRRYQQELRARKKAEKAGGRKTQSKTRAPEVIPGIEEKIGNEHALLIDFSQHPDVLKRVKEVADREIRTPENQVLYWIKEFSDFENEDRDV